jgi:hypothetical protein
VDTHAASLLFQADEAIDIGVVDEVTDLTVAEATLRALKVDNRHTKPPAR